MQARFLAFAMSAFGFAGLASAQCGGCEFDNSGWEGSAGNDHKWEYTPAPADAEGTCDPATCAWTPCAFKGTLTFTNNGTVAVEVHDPSGVIVQVVLGGGGTYTSPALNIKGRCGQADELDDWYGAHPLGGGGRLSGYIFSCTGCFDG